MAREWPMEFKAADVAALINDQTNATGKALRDFLLPGAP
jgi:hypothetical protein